jgi:hypothetical protein
VTLEEAEKKEEEDKDGFLNEDISEGSQAKSVGAAPKKANLTTKVFF